MTAEQHLLEQDLKTLYLTTFRRNYRPFAEDAAQSQQSYEHYLQALAAEEVAHRERNRQQRRIKEARFPVRKELVDFNFAAVPSLSQQQVVALARGDYITQAQPLILVGNPGLGKTHIATSLALAACRQGRRVRFYTAASLVNALIAAQDAHQLQKFLDAALRYQLIVLDELGFIPFTTTGAQLIFQFCATLYERVALIITTNLRFADWVQVFGDERLTAALLDRLTHHAHILEFSGADSYRFRERLQREHPPANPEAT